jgi:hypothetical protein
MLFLLYRYIWLVVRTSNKSTSNSRVGMEEYLTLRVLCRVRVQD